MITALPPVIGSLTRGAVKTSPSSKIAIVLPTSANVGSTIAILLDGEVK